MGIACMEVKMGSDTTYLIAKKLQCNQTLSQGTSWNINRAKKKRV